jgi:hypothetical protein
MAKAPRAIGLFLCRRAEVDTAAVEYSLIGLIRTLSFAKWPALAPPILAFAALQGGNGEGTMEVVGTQMATERDIYRWRRWQSLPGPRGLGYLEAPIRRCVFPGPGRYRFTLKFDGEELTQRLLDVLPQGEHR